MKRSTATRVIRAIGTGTESAGRLVAFLPVTAKAQTATVRRGGAGSTAGQPGRRMRAEDINAGQQRETERKVRKRVDRRQDDIGTATRNDAEDIVSESKEKEGSIFHAGVWRYNAIGNIT